MPPFGLPPARLEALLAHQLANIRRHDYLVNILQSVAEALLFYHPAMWWVSGQIRAEREFCCDDVHDAPLTFAVDDSLAGLVGRPPDFGDGSGVSIFTAIREQLGLEIEGGSPTELLVIYSIEIP